MATVLGDYGEQSRFHNMISTSGLQHQRSSHSSPHDGHNHAKDPHSASRYRSVSSSRDAPPRRQPSASPRDPPQFSSSTTSSSGSGTRNGGADARCAAQTHTQSQARKSWDTSVAATSDIPKEDREGQHHTNGGASRFPSPPSSSSPSISSGSARPQQHAQPASPPPPMASSSSAHDADRPVTSAASSSTATSGSSAATVVATSQAATGAGAIPSPASDSGARWSSAGHLEQSAAPTSPPQAQTTIHVRDLAHIQSLARADLLTGNGPGILNDPPLQAMKYEISGMPIGDIIEMVAALLTKITTTNDLQHDALNRNATHLKQAQAANSSGDGAGGGGGGSGDAPHMSPLSSSVLAFHGKNVPAITILSYLSRIHKYCPTTYEVFLSLLVYFDRMTERVNEMVMKSEEARRLSAQHPETARPASIQGVEVDPDTVMGDAESDDSDEIDSDLADDDDDDDDDEEVDDAHVPQPGRQGKKRSSSTSGGGSGAVASTRPRDGSAGGAARANVPPATSTAAAQATYFVVDSFNIHRLIIAGVTCASKFFSDVFYTNSRYAKVGGLPLAELNHLELQFLLLNDFRLAVPVEDLEAYATMLVEFYAREVVAQRSRPVAGME